MKKSLWFLFLIAPAFNMFAQDEHVQGNLMVDGVARIDGGVDLVGQGLAIYPDSSEYEGGSAPVLEVTSDGDIVMRKHNGDIPMGQFSPALDLSALSDSSYEIESHLVAQDGQNWQSTEINFGDYGREMVIGDNSWKKLAFNYTVTPNTKLTFEFKSDDDGELFAIGMDDDTYSDGDSYMLFLLGGVQTITRSADWNINYRDYTVGIDGWKRYSIPVGQFYGNAQMSYLVFICDEDRVRQSAEARFRNVVITD